MGSERLVIPEEHVLEVVKLITEGLKTADVPGDVKEPLMGWCDGMLKYYGRLEALEELTSDAQELGLGY